MKQQATATSNEQNEYLPSNSRGYSLELAPDLSPASKILKTVGEILPIMHQISEKWICGGPVPHCDDLVRELRDWEERQRTRKSEVGDLQLHIPTERGHFFPVMRKSELLKQKNEGAQLVEARKTYSHSHPSPIIFDLKWNLTCGRLREILAPIPCTPWRQILVIDFVWKNMWHFSSTSKFCGFKSRWIRRRKWQCSKPRLGPTQLSTYLSLKGRYLNFEDICGKFKIVTNCEIWVRSELATS